MAQSVEVVRRLTDQIQEVVLGMVYACDAGAEKPWEPYDATITALMETLAYTMHKRLEARMELMDIELYPDDEGRLHEELTDREHVVELIEESGVTPSDEVLEAWIHRWRDARTVSGEGLRVL
ncbi:MAG: hypothetical protein AB7N76_13605 [Planctomycetota bacterium]